MDNYVTSATIRTLREKKKLTQKELADLIGVSDKAVSKWESKRGLPDISLLEPLAGALNISVAELLSGEYVSNDNKSSNLLRSKFYVCPICGNVIHTMGETMISCCGISLPVIEIEEMEENHAIEIEKIENEYFVSLHHEMSKSHYITFIAYITSDRLEMKKLYPEQDSFGRFSIHGHGKIFAYCNKHGLFCYKV